MDTMIIDDDWEILNDGGDEEGFEVDMDKWRDSLPEELRSTDMIKNAKDLGSIAQMAVDNKRMVGQKTEEFLGSIPANGDSPEGATALDSVYSKLGWPGAEGKYEVTRPEAVDGLNYSEEREAAFLEVAKAQKFNVNQVNAMIAMDHEMQKGILAKNLEEATAANETLKADWGNKYDANKAEVKAILEKRGDDSLIKLFNETELGSHAGFVKLLHDLGKGIIEKGALGHGEGGQGGISKDEAQKQIAANYSSTEFMTIYGDPKNPAYKEKREEMHKLHQAVHGTKIAIE